MQLIFEKSVPGRSVSCLPEEEIEEEIDARDIPKEFLRDDLKLPEVSEVDIVRHFTALSKRNFGVDDGFYPLGSCTMKYNPRINEDMARLDGFSQIHPYQDDVEGALQLIYELQEDLKEISGMKAFSLQPAAGAHGELTGLMLFKAYFKDKGQKRTKILAPDSSHGTNPASATICGFETVVVKSNGEGGVDIEDLKSKMTEQVAGLMLTNPNTLGIFDRNISEITKIVHDKGGLCYYDGANMNAIMGIARPGDMGFDVIHLNLHKSFSTPHGGGGPGSGPVGVNDKLVSFLPVPVVAQKGDKYILDFSADKSIGQVMAFFGNFGILVRAYTYIKGLGCFGLKKVSEDAVLNANYIKEKLKQHYNLPYDRICQHEFVLDDSRMPNGVTTNDIAKRLLDYGIHAPTVYFPLIVHGAIMIEPTETESKQECDRFIDAMIKIKEESEKNPGLVKKAPQKTPVKKLDAVAAARNPNLKWEW